MTMNKEKKSVGVILSTVTMAIMIAVILVLVIFSASGYQRSVDSEDYNSNTRALLSYVITCVRDNNAAEIAVEEMAGSDGLVIRDRETGSEQRLYMYDGKLLEENTVTGMPPVPEDAILIGETEIFRVRFVEEGLLEVRTDAGTSYVNTSVLEHGEGSV